MWRVLFSEAAVRQFRGLSKEAQARIREGVRVHLQENDPSESTRNKFRLRRASVHAEFELRLGDCRVFYRARRDVVEIVMIGEKRGNRLLIEGEEFEL